MTLRIQPRYDHSYYFIASSRDHLRFHARYLRDEREIVTTNIEFSSAARNSPPSDHRGAEDLLFKSAACWRT